MRTFIAFVATVVTIVAGFPAERCFAQTNNRASGAYATTSATKPAAQFQFILFYKQKDVATQQLSGALQAAVERRSDRATWTEANLTDPATKTVADRYGVSRAPMPLVICVASNGAVTGAFPRKLNDQEVDRAMVTPAMTEVVKTLQDKQLAIVHLKPDANAPLPFGALEFMADPAFQSKTRLIEIVSGDPTESRFFTDLGIDKSKGEVPVLLVLAPPGVLVGKFPATVTKAQIGEKVHAAGQCCNDPNCKHNKKAK